ncbi:MAG TPA: Rha family transcriptional regulator, partial [Cellvibrionaceae bacterium]|nr:Rha family transcriptional regulator [Cellvibrionaceae bacterium]
MTAQIIPFIPQDAITFNHNQIRTNSLKVAEAFGKRHDNVLRNIKTLECSPEFTQLNFEVSEYQDTTGRTLTMWEMTKDGFMFLVMGFTGKKAAAIKEAYINAFNAMEAHLRISAQPARQEQKDFLPINVRECMKIEASTAVASLNLSQELIAAIEKKAFSLAQEAFNLSLDHLYQRVAY